MTTLLKPGIRKIMEIFYRNRNKAIHLRELSRMTKLQGQSITRYLKQLENTILSSKKEANLKRYSIKKDRTAFALFSLFDVERLQSLPKIRQKAIDTYLNALPEYPVFALLFGSTAKGTYSKDSDIDILIITNKKIETKPAEKESDSLTAIKISTFQMTYDNFIKELRLKDDPVIQSAVESGFPLINHIRYYEVAFDERV